MVSGVRGISSRGFGHARTKDASNVPRGNMQLAYRHRGVHTCVGDRTRVVKVLPSRRKVSLHVTAAASTDTTSAAQQAAALKQDIVALSGKKYGHDLDQAQRQQIEAKVQQLEDLQLPVDIKYEKLTGSRWTTVYTTSTGTSSGKVGPFITDVVQMFPADEPCVYYNESRLGLVCARLRGDYTITSGSDRVDLQFSDLAIKVGPFQAAKKEFGPQEGRGHWTITYCDDDFRVFTTNMGNLFVLRKL